MLVAGWMGFAMMVWPAPDSGVTRMLKLNTQVSASLSLLNNWKNESNTQYVLMLYSVYQSNRKSTQIEFNNRLELQVGGTGYIDSLFKKDTDRFAWQGMMKRSGRKISHAFNGGFNTMLFDQYSFSSDPVTRSIIRKQTGSFGNPSALEFGYGLGLSFWKNSTVGISLASARFHVDPVFESSPSAGQNRIMDFRNSILVFDYGISCQWAIERGFRNLIWTTAGNFFVKGWRNDAVRFDSSHSMRYKLMKFLQLKADVRWVFEPLESMSMQYRNEWLFGIVYEKNRGP
jgi:hypothetical protein